ncbi:MAG: hypothetical protein OCD00_20215, partial [Colwellia sp.]
MRNNKIKFNIVLSILLLIPLACFGGPGGFIAKGLFGSLLGKIIFGILIIVLLPILLIILLKEEFAIRRTLKDLKFLSRIDQRFDWLSIKKRALECYYQVHSSWTKEDMSEATKYMTNWYWQNQQIVFLNRWAREDLKNICEIKTIKSLSPVLFIHKNDSKEHEDSLLV